MPVFNNILAGAAGQSGGDAAYKIERSLRFNDDDSAHLDRTPSSAGNQKTWTWSGWIKNTFIHDDFRSIFSAYGGSGNAYTMLQLKDMQLRLNSWTGSASNFDVKTSAKLRDTAAWYHIVCAVDTTQSTASDRVKLYINNVLQTQFENQNYPTQNFDTYVNNTTNHEIGQIAASAYSGFFDGYMAEIHFVDGQQLAATDFGEYDEDTGVWNPIAFTGTYNFTPTVTYPAVYVTSPGTYGAVTDVNTVNGSVFSSAGSTGAGSIKVEFASAITGVTHVKFKGGGYSVNAGFSIKVNGSTTHSSLTTNSMYAVRTETLSSATDITSFEIVSGSDGWALGDLQFSTDGTNFTAPSGTAAVIPSAGVNGFHLDFSDNSSNAALGTDSSRNNNTWTVNNIVGPGGDIDYASMITQQSNGGYYTNYGPEKAFDGVLTTAPNTSASNNNGNITFTPSPSISFTTSVRAYWANGNTSATYSYNGGSATSITANGWITLASGSGTFTSLNTNRDGDGQYFSAIEVDGTILLNSTGKDNDSLLDTPTNYEAASGNNGGNYATWNVLTKKGSVSTSNGNLEANATNSGTGYVLSTIPVSSGKFYCEISFEGTMSHNTNYSYLGIVPTDSAASYSGNDIFRASGALSIDGNAQTFIRGTLGTGGGENSNTYQSSYGFDENDTIGIAIDCDTPQVTFYKNGVSTGTFPHAMQVGKSWVVFVNDWANASDTEKYILNAGQRPFSFAPPSGFKAICTQNLDDPLIEDPSTAFDAKTFTANNGSQSISLGFSPDLVWTKSRANSYEHQIFDTVRGNNQQLVPSSSVAERNLANSLTFDSSGFTMPSNNNNANFGSGGSVAWAWDAGSSNTTIAAGGLNSSVYDQSQTWSNQVTGTAYSGYPKTKAFDSQQSVGALPADNNELVFTPSPAFSNASTVKIWYYYPTTHANAFKINGTAVGNDLTSTSGVLTHTFNVSGFTSLSWSRTKYGSEDTGIARIDVDGVRLVDSGVSVTNVPSIASTVRANPTAGFSIVSFTGNGTSGSTVGHGLNGAVPKMVIMKNRDTASTDWRVYNTMVDGSLDILYLNSSVNKNNSSLATHTGNVFTVGSSLSTNENNSDFIAYCFAPVEGYSKFGSYTGNGSSNGTFIYTGFRPNWILIKNTDTANNWLIYDAVRNSFNTTDLSIQADEANTETNLTNDEIDILSNGFKVRCTRGDVNSNGDTIVYASFASHPFKYARAR